MHQDTLREVWLDHIKPCRFDDPKRFPTDPEHVKRLIESIKTTGFWSNIIVRPTGNGRYEAAFGRHRLEALAKKISRAAKVPVIVREMNDVELLQIWSRENITQRSQDSMVWMQVTRGIMQAFAEGIFKFQGDRKEQLHYVLSTSAAPDKINRALAAIDMIDAGLLTEKHFIGLTLQKADLLVRNTREAKEKFEYEADLLEKGAEQREKAAPVMQARGEHHIAESNRGAAKQAREHAKRLRAAAIPAAKEVGDQIARKLGEGGRDSGRRRIPLYAARAAAAIKEQVVASNPVQQDVTGKHPDVLPEINEFIGKLATRLRTLLNRDNSELTYGLREALKPENRIHVMPAKWRELLDNTRRHITDMQYWEQQILAAYQATEKAWGIPTSLEEVQIPHKEPKQICQQ